MATTVYETETCIGAPLERVGTLFSVTQNGSFQSHNTRKSLGLGDFYLVLSEFLRSVAVQFMYREWLLIRWTT